MPQTYPIGDLAYVWMIWVNLNVYFWKQKSIDANENELTKWTNNNNNNENEKSQKCKVAQIFIYSLKVCCLFHILNKRLTSQVYNITASAVLFCIFTFYFPISPKQWVIFNQNYMHEGYLQFWWKENNISGTALRQQFKYLASTKWPAHNVTIQYSSNRRVKTKKWVRSRQTDRESKLINSYAPNTLHYTPWEFPNDGGGKAKMQYINNRSTYLRFSKHLKPRLNVVFQFSRLLLWIMHIYLLCIPWIAVTGWFRRSTKYYTGTVQKLFPFLKCTRIQDFHTKILTSVFTIMLKSHDNIIYNTNFRHYNDS